MADETSKRETKVQRIFVDEAGEAHARATLDTKVLVFKYADDSETRFDLKSICPGEVLIAPSVARAAMAFGINTSAGNLAGPMKDADPAMIREAIEGRLDLFTNGSWSTSREGGTRPSDLVEAWVMFRTANGTSTSDERRAKFIEQIKDEEYRDSTAGEPQIKANLAKIRSDRAAAKAAETAQAAKGSSVNSALLD